MPSAIWKFPLKTTDTQRVTMPKGAEILTVQTQNEEPCLWAKFNKDSDGTEERHFVIHGTGHLIADTFNEQRYIGTYQLRGGALVFHVFELIPK